MRRDYAWVSILKTFFLGGEGVWKSYLNINTAHLNLKMLRQNRQLNRPPPRLLRLYPPTIIVRLAVVKHNLRIHIRLLLYL